ncbi:hypothetical protein QYH69_11135 [Paraburkholderia sp. SARCC-3016]|uniref:hypothetical protein n=1 Tax=Paraburkholderia sp. SARCC-3016 TaxID=3058611 RepID=UPI002807D257|nr:hypothetical protein [Paraburkholderia sp. SARCC-3016]MDQ7977794.1 hypothetical protein [Paraburkholderia sp. SARCC-3016]
MLALRTTKVSFVLSDATTMSLPERRADRRRDYRRLPVAASGRIIHFAGDLPLTATGKVIAREPGKYMARAALAIFGTTMFCKAQIFD